LFFRSPAFYLTNILFSDFSDLCDFQFPIRLRPSLKSAISRLQFRSGHL